MSEYKRVLTEALHSKFTERRDYLVSKLSKNYGVPFHKVPELMHDWFQSDRLLGEGGDWEPHDEHVKEILGKHLVDKEPLSMTDLINLGELLDGIKELNEALVDIKKGELNFKKITHLIDKHNFNDVDIANMLKDNLT